MKCPNCGYVHGWDDDTQETVYGEEDCFFKLPIEMKREVRFYAVEEVNVYGCPSCKFVFIST